MSKMQTLLRLPLFPIGIALSLVFLSVWVQTSRIHKLDDLEMRAFHLCQKVSRQEKGRAEEQAILTQMETAKKAFLETTIAPLTFLKEEISKENAHLRAHPEDKKSKQRLEFLQNNHLRFREKNFQRLGKLQEVEVIQEKPVEMNGDELKYLLSQLENVSIGPYAPESPPYFLIKNFDLIKKTLSPEEESFVIQCELVKQEIVHE